MKKVLIIPALASTLLLSYAEELPFIGQIYDSPSGGNSYHITFEIKPDNTLTIEGCGTTSCGFEYKGKYSKQIFTEYGGYIFEDNKIYYTDKAGNKIRANNEDCYAHAQSDAMFCEVSTLNPDIGTPPPNNEIANKLGLPFLGQVHYTLSSNVLVNIDFKINTKGILNIKACSYKTCKIVYNDKYKSYIEAVPYNFLFEDDKVYLTEKNKIKIYANSKDCFSNIVSNDLYCVRETNDPDMRDVDLSNLKE